MSKYDFGVIGMGVMGRNLAMNIADNGFSVVVYNRAEEISLAKEAVAESGGKLAMEETLEGFVKSLKSPRRMLMMIKAGKPVDMVMESLKPHLDKGDIVIDGGNSWFEDTVRREKDYAKSGLRFFGAGVSGGEEGARNGPSIMPGGDPEGYEAIRPIFEAITAKTDSGSCVTHVGPDGAGHFVKMVHNGIEYADMQFIAEAYHILESLGGFTPPEMAEIFKKWNEGPLESFLIEITSQILKYEDPKGQGYLVDKVLDKAGQKGTGMWTAQTALTHGVSIPSIAAAIDARVLSSIKDERVKASKLLQGPSSTPASANKEKLVQQVHDALYAAKIVAYAQGMDLIKKVSEELNWDVNLSEMARIWKGGCIIRARFLDRIMTAYQSNTKLANLLLDGSLGKDVMDRQGTWRELVAKALVNGIPVPGLVSGLSYFDAYRSAKLPQSLTQAQRDAFGAHTYQRNDEADSQFVHTDWLEALEVAR